jgi:ectoine hydroxylase-related dioxygenase (phytanoyl-CoA dioxygenase family)
MTDPGFWIEDAVVSERECLELAELLASNGRAGIRHLMANRRVAELARNERLLNIARNSLGHGAVPFRATLFAKAGHTNWLVAWHQDRSLPLESYVKSAEWGPWSRKGGILYAGAPAWALSRVLALRIHLDASVKDNGPLRVMPGSHAAGLLTASEIHDVSMRQECIECLVPRGGILAMRPLLIHSSSKTRSALDRRILHIEYADSLDLAPGIRLAIA